jgi:hypothetical protein
MGKVILFRSQREQHPIERRSPNIFLDRALSYRSHLLSAAGAIGKVSKQMKKEEFVRPHYYSKLLEPVQQIEHSTNVYYRHLDRSTQVPTPIRTARYSLLVLLHTIELQAKELGLLLTEAHLHALRSTTPSFYELRARQDILGQIDVLVRGSRNIARQISGLVQQIDTQEEQLVYS